MKLKFDNMYDCIENMPKGARILLHYEDNEKQKDIVDEVKIVEYNDDFIKIEKSNGDIQTIDWLCILDVTCLDKLKLVIE